MALTRKYWRLPVRDTSEVADRKRSRARLPFLCGFTHPRQIMVSSQLSDALANPTRVIKELYSEYAGDDFATHVAEHFKRVFDDEHAFRQVNPQDPHPTR